MKILYTGGGTLGSVTPLLAVAENDGADDRLWIGTVSGPERQHVEKQKIPFVAIKAFRLRRFASIKTLLELPYLFTSYLKALSILKKFKPDVVLTAGSFTGVPVCLAARRLGIPYIVLQLDVTTGLANKLLFSRAARVIVPHATYKKKMRDLQVEVCGIPVTETFTQKISKKKTIVFLGGGTGSMWINNFVYRNLPVLLAEADVVHFQGSSERATHIPKAAKGYTAVLHADREEMMRTLHRARIVISRAGMGTLAELSELKKATIIVPMPSSHQEKNAAFFSSHHAALLVHQSQGDDALLKEIKNLLQNSELHQTLSDNIYSLLPHNASRCVQSIIRSVVV